MEQTDRRYHEESSTGNRKYYHVIIIFGMGTSGSTSSFPLREEQIALVGADWSRFHKSVKS